MKNQQNAARVAVQAEPCPNDLRMLALQCTWDIRSIAEALILMADEISGDVRFEGLLRCYGMRIDTLNSMLMGYLDGCGTPEREMYRKVFGRSKPEEGAAA